MARTHSSYTASPTRWRSPQRSPARQTTSEEGSQYEMDLDALGLNSTFESTDIDDKHKPKVDVVDTSDIEGPDDFTMNMTYWMTADLSARQQIRSRKEANAHVTELRGDVQRGAMEDRDTSVEQDQAVLEESVLSRDAHAELNSVSPTMRLNGTAGERSSSKAASEVSMENEEKVRSYLSALPDTDIGGEAITSTPLRIPKQNMLQVPSPGPTKTRSLQATVEDYDTPRKPTQETVIHHPPERALAQERDELLQKLADLQSRLEQRELVSKTRTTELETLLQYTKDNLETAQADGYKLKERVKSLQVESERQKKEIDDLRASVDAQLYAHTNDMRTKLQEYGEELSLQSHAKLQKQKLDFNRQLQQMEDEKRDVEASLSERDHRLRQLEEAMANLRESQEQQLPELKGNGQEERDGPQDWYEERTRMQNSLSTLQTRANALQSDLQRATDEAKSAREDAEGNARRYAGATANNRAQKSRMADLEAQLSSTQFQLECARTEESARKQRTSDLEVQIQSLRSQMEATQGVLGDKEREINRISAHTHQIESLRGELDAARADVASKDQQLLRQIEEKEQCEQRLHAALGRIEGLENTVATLRQQLAEAHRDTAKSRTEVERLEHDLEDVSDRLQDSRAEADRRVADIESKLSKIKEMKAEAESAHRGLQSRFSELVESHKAALENVREKAEDAVRKAGSLLEQERSEKKRIAKDLKKTSHALDQLRAELAQKAAEGDESSADESSTFSSSHVDPKDAEIENLRTLLRKQSSTMKTLRSETNTLRKENTHLKTLELSHETIADLQTELSDLRQANLDLRHEAEIREADFEAVNKAMDERLAAMLSKMLKERTKHVVGKRDGQWAESVGRVNNEKELMGRVLLREWGRQEVGVAKEAEGEKQKYRYQYVQRP